MDDGQAKECRTREADSLEQAKQAKDESLKHLHETIALQFRLLAEVIETGRTPTKPPVASGPDMAAAGVDADATLDAPQIQPFDEPDVGAQQVMSTTEEVENLEQISPSDYAGTQTSPHTQEIASLDHETLEMNGGGAPTYAEARNPSSLDDHLSEVEDDATHVRSLDGDQITEMDHSGAEGSPKETGIAPADDQILETHPSAVQVSAGSAVPATPAAELAATDLCPAELSRVMERVSGPDASFVETFQDTVGTSGSAETTKSLKDNFSKTDDGIPHLSLGLENRDDNEIAATDKSGAEVSSAAIEERDGQSLETNADIASAGSAAVETAREFAASEPCSVEISVAESISGPDEPTAERPEGTAPARWSTEGMNSLTDQISNTDQVSSQVRWGGDGIERLGETDDSAAGIRPGAKSVKSTDGAAEHDRGGPKTARVETPFAWIFSGWFGGGRR